MTDRRTRELERRLRGAEEGGDRVALLTQRLRKGELSHNKLSVLAFLGYEAAARAGGEAAPVTWVDELERHQRPGRLPAQARRFAARRFAQRWARGLLPCGLEALVRASLAAVQAVAPDLESWEGSTVRECLELSRRWLAEGPDLAEACREAGDRAEQEAQAREDSGDDGDEQRGASDLFELHVVRAAGNTAGAAGAITLGTGADFAGEVFRHCSVAWCLRETGTTSLPPELGDVPGTFVPAVEDAVTEALIEWALR